MAIARFFVLVLYVCAVLGVRAAPFRPPAVPILTIDPLVSTWSMADHLYDDWPRYWPGQTKALAGLIRVDGSPFRFLGPAQQNGGALPPPIPQISVVVNPTQTIYQFANKVIMLNVTFVAPMNVNDLESMAPLNIARFSVASLDGKPHDVQLYLDSTGEIAVNDATKEEVVWQRVKNTNGLDVLLIGSQKQEVLQLAGDAVGINWGYFYLAAKSSSQLTSRTSSALLSRETFIKTGRLPDSDDTCMPRLASDDWPVLALSWNFSSSLSSTATAFFVYDDLYSIYYFGQQFLPFWRRNSPKPTPQAGLPNPLTIKPALNLLATSVKNVEMILNNCGAWDRALLDSAVIKGGAEYATLVALAYRQTVGATKLVWNDELKMPWYFMKEISSDGDLSTVDVIYPAHPFFIYYNPVMLEYLLLPILAYAANETHSTTLNYTLSWAPHHLGYYPVGNIEVKQQENMPVEETGNMLIMLAAIDQRVGLFNAWPKYSKLLYQWADYLITVLPDPGTQLCTDDFEGPSPHNANLAAKGILALSAFAEICENYGDNAGATKYRSVAAKFMGDWQRLANDGNHTRLQYNLPSTFSLKYNVAIQQILKLKMPFPTAVMQEELDFYIQSKMNTYGTPLDDRATFTKLDWLSWVAATGDNDQFQTLIHAIYRFANETPNRVPLTDWYETIQPTQKGFQARPVVGGLYLRLCHN